MRDHLQRGLEPEMPGERDAVADVGRRAGDRLQQRDHVRRMQPGAYRQLRIARQRAQGVGVRRRTAAGLSRDD